MSTTISGDWETANLNGGPYWANNLDWNVGNLVNGTDFTESLTMNNPTSPNIGTTISWNFPNTPALYNVYSYPNIGYGTAGGNAPATSITAEQIDNIQTLTLSNNITLSGNPDQYDVIYDMGLTSVPQPTAAAIAAGAPFSALTHEIEVDIHTPSYMQSWINSLPHQSFTDANGTQWTIAENNSGNPPMVLFMPANGQDLTNATIDFKSLLQAAVADGVLSGNEYFNGLGLGAEPQQGSGSITINSFSVNYDGDPNHASSTGGTQTGSSTTSTTSTAGTDTSHNQSTTTGSSTTTTSTTGTDTSHNQSATTGSSADTTSTAGTDTTHNQSTTTGSSADTTSGTDTTHNQSTTTGSSTTTTSTAGTDTGNNQTTTTGSSSDTTSAPATGTGQDSSSNTHHHHHGASSAQEQTTGGGGAAASDGGGGHNLHHDIVALLQALQQNNTTAVNNAVTALGNDVHAASAADTGSAPGVTDHHVAHHFEHMWH